ncbi:beta-lactamase [Ignicoccus pacificus DSM 13166]|uniref:Beta-lactamase n=1 Tax=Ignicoccus pacificus DSM 13166 TaxID=940294 RepID=A0A977KAW5_9CREN|nr:beta-lactamase [Ignicoccus pacificus DSM 13166]
MRVTILSDVYAGLVPHLVKGLLAEYGFSAVVQDGDFQILFDAGLTGTVALSNAEKLGIEIRPNFIVVSHGHLDHTGGLPKVLEKVKAPVIAHPEAFEPKFAMIGGKLYEIGFPMPRHKLEEMTRVIATKSPLQITDRIFFSGEIPRKWGPTHSGLVYKVDPEKGVIQDLVKDDAALYIKTPKGLFVVTGCGHSGVENIVEYGLEVTKEKKLYGILGGLHLLGATEERMIEVAKYLASKNPEIVVPTHCTGQRAQYLLMKELGDAYREGGPGVSVEL